MKKIIFFMWICMLFLSSCQKEEPEWTDRKSDLQITESPLKTAATEADKEPPKKDISEYKDCRAIIKSSIQPAPDEEVIDVGGRILCWIPPATVAESCGMAELPAMYAGKYVRNEEGFYEQFFEYGDKDYYGKVDETTGDFVLFEPWKTFDEMKNAVLEVVGSEK